MNPADASRLLAIASTACPTVPKPTAEVARGWSLILVEIDLGDALDAATALIRETGEVTPHLIHKRVLADLRDRAGHARLDEARHRGEVRAAIESGDMPVRRPRHVDAIADALAVACRFCHVSAGYRCRIRGEVDDRGEELFCRIPHSGRIADARRAIEAGDAERPGQLALPAGSAPTPEETPA